MSFSDLLFHLLNFAAPACFLALVLPWLGRWMQRAPPLAPWWAQMLINLAVGLLALGLNLVWWGHDGKMASYAALIIASATCQWVLVRGWRR